MPQVASPAFFSKPTMKSGILYFLFLVSILLIVLSPQEANSATFGLAKKMIDKANKKGPYIGIVIPNLFEMNPLLNYPEYKSSKLIIDVGGTCV